MTSEIRKTIDDASAPALTVAARQNSGGVTHAQAIPARAGTTTTIQPRRHYLYQLGNEMDLTEDVSEQEWSALYIPAGVYSGENVRLAAEKKQAISF